MQGVIAQITPVRLGVLEVGSGRSFPPVLFVHMAQRDPEFAASVAEALDFCRWVGEWVGRSAAGGSAYLAGPVSAHVWQSLCVGASCWCRCCSLMLPLPCCCVCREAGIPAAEIRVDPRAVTPQFLQRSPLIGREMAEGIVAALREAVLLDEVGPCSDAPA
jgi:hypothetical protein